MCERSIGEEAQLHRYARAYDGKQTQSGQRARNISQIPPAVWDEGNGSLLHRRHKILGVSRKKLANLVQLTRQLMRAMMANMQKIIRR
jgi:hypothetical protein